MIGWALSYVGSNFALIMVVTLAVIALGAIAWFVREWKVAVAAVVVLAAGLAYQQIDKNAYQRRVSEEAAAQVAVLKDRIDTLNRINAEDAERATEDASRIEELNRLAHETPPNSGPCLNTDAAKRIGGIR